MTTTLDHATAARSGNRSSRPPATTRTGPPTPVTGILDIQEEHGFLRVDGYVPGPQDLYVPAALIHRHGLRAGDRIDGAAPAQAAQPPETGRPRPPKAHPLARVDLVNGRPTDQPGTRPHFTELTPVHPRKRLRLETDPGELGTRVIDLLAPIGKGQRGLIVSQPKTGKTMLLQSVAKAITRNHPECTVMVVLLDERPEEVTDMTRSVDAEVIASTFDRPAHEHVAIAELAIERAKRLAETGQDVVILLDSITRLCRAYNNTAKSSGRTLSGGIDASAVAKPKQLFGAARALAEGGSVTILATALIDTGSRADDYFFEELKSTGNMELRLDRGLANKRVFPAIEFAGSSTRRDELFVPADELDAVRRLRRVLAGQPGGQGVEVLLDRMKQTTSNAEFLLRIRQTAPSA